MKDDDVRSTPAGVNGPDVQLSTKGKRYFPYSVECKNQEVFKGIYKVYDQAVQDDGLEPLVVLKSNRREPLVIIHADHFFDLLKKIKE